MSNKLICDQELYERFQKQGEDCALDLLATRHGPRACHLAKQICGDANLAEEAVQDVFVAILSRRARYEIQDSKSSFKAWFFTLVTNRARMARRAEARARRKSTRPLTEGPHRSPAIPPAADEGYRELYGFLQTVTKSEAPAWHKAFWNHLSHGLKQREIARELSVSQQLISRRINQIRLRLQHELMRRGYA